MILDRFVALVHQSATDANEARSGSHTEGLLGPRHRTKPVRNAIPRVCMLLTLYPRPVLCIPIGSAFRRLHTFIFSKFEVDLGRQAPVTVSLPYAGFPAFSHKRTTLSSPPRQAALWLSVGNGSREACTHLSLPATKSSKAHNAKFLDLRNSVISLPPGLNSSASYALKVCTASVYKPIIVILHLQETSS